MEVVVKKRLAFVVQRYGLEVNGGAEQLVRQMAEHLKDIYDVEVITTKAIDYITWKDEYTESIEVINGITIRRFGVRKPRDIKKFEHISHFVNLPVKLGWIENRWIDEQGPQCPELINYLEQHVDDYDVFTFMTYLYYTTVRGLPKVAHKAILIPTAHDEPTIYMKIYREVFHLPRGLFYCTQTEKRFVEQLFHNEAILNNEGFGGAGVELLPEVDRNVFKKKYQIEHYMVYAGRIDINKGCGQLFEFFDKFKSETKIDIKLVMMGKVIMDVPQRDDILNLGFVSEQEKLEVMSAADFLIMPSQFESLSMVVLEALALGVPVIVNGLCEVLKAHCCISEAGLYYTCYNEFKTSVMTMMNDSNLRKEMGQKGVQYIDQYYRWNSIIKRFSDMVEQISTNTGRE